MPERQLHQAPPRGQHREAVVRRRRVGDGALLQRARAGFAGVELRQHGLHRCVEVRIVHVEQEVAADIGLRQLLVDTVVAEVELEITARLLGEVVVRECIQHPALLRHLQVVELRQVEIIRGSLHQSLVGARVIEGEAVGAHAGKARGGELGRRGGHLRRCQRETAIGDVTATGKHEAHAAARGRAIRRVRTIRRADERGTVALGGDAPFAIGQLRPIAAVVAREAIALVVVQRDHGIATAFAEISAQREIGAVGGCAGRGVETILPAELNAFEVILHDEVDDTGDRVGAVHRRRTAGDDFRTLDERGGNRVEVGDLFGTEDGVTATVDQSQAARGAESPEVGVRGAGGRAGGNRVGRGATVGGLDELRRVAQHLVDIHRAGQLEFLGIDDGQRRRCIRRTARDARTGHDDVFAFGGCLRSVLRPREPTRGQSQCYCRGESGPASKARI